jgi:phospholipid N-methyltransferase
MARQVSHYVTFFREFRRAFRTTGAITPSGRHLARNLIRETLRHTSPARIVEVGAGTGAVTQEIIRHLSPGDQFDIVELNDRFVEVLNERFRHEPDFQRVAAQCRVLHMPVQELQAAEPYDFLICGLPFNNFPTSLVEEIFQKFDELIRPNGVLTFFEYLWIHRLKFLVASSPERERMAGVRSVMKRYRKSYEFRSDKVFANMPPAIVYHLRLDSASKVRSSDDHIAA